MAEYRVAGLVGQAGGDHLLAFLELHTGARNWLIRGVKHQDVDGGSHLGISPRQRL